MKITTEKQASFIHTLWGQVYPDIEEPDQLIPEDRKNASDLISALLEAKKTVAASAPAEAKTTTYGADPEPGFYYVDGDVYKVQQNRAKTNSYAKVLHGTSWEYIGKSPFRLFSEDTKLTYELAAEWGIQSGICLICGAHLDNVESAQYGIGPVCFKNLTGNTFAQARKIGELPEKGKPPVQGFTSDPVDGHNGHEYWEAIEAQEAHIEEMV